MDSSAALEGPRVFITTQSLVPVRAKVDWLPSAGRVRLTRIGLPCGGQVAAGSRRGIKDKPARRAAETRGGGCFHPAACRQLMDRQPDATTLNEISVPDRAPVTRHR